MTKLPVLAVALALLGGCATVPQSSPDGELDRLAEAYVKTSLEIGTHEESYIDAYYGPPEWKAAAQAKPRDKAALIVEVARLRTAVGAVAVTEPLLVDRRDNLKAQLRAADARLRMLSGERFSFDEEARLLYGAAPQVRSLSSFDAALVTLDKLLPGPGSLADRATAYNDRFIIPDQKVDDAIIAATAACKASAARHIPMPRGENYKLELVRDKVWSGYNWYKGNAQSLIQVNLDSDVTPDRAVVLGCHEGYPGHHLYNALLEERLTRGRGWREFSVYPLYSPQSLLAEGSADYGKTLAFDDAGLLALVRDTLFPIAGFDPAEAPRYLAFLKAQADLEEASPMIGRELIDGRMSDAEAIAAYRKYSLRNEAQAKRQLAFAKANRAYIINYVTGEHMVKAWIDAHVATGMTQWQAMELLLTTPVVLRQ